MLEFCPDKLHARRYTCRQMARVSKIAIFPQLEPLAKLRNRISFSKLQLPYGSFFDAVYKNALKMGFGVVSFLAFFLTRSPDSGHENFFAIYSDVGPDLQFTNVPSVRSKTRPLPRV